MIKINKGICKSLLNKINTKFLLENVYKYFRILVFAYKAKVTYKNRKILVLRFISKV